MKTINTKYVVFKYEQSEPYYIMTTENGTQTYFGDKINADTFQTKEEAEDLSRSFSKRKCQLYYTEEFSSAI